jgi:uncharacterized protein with PQ loop repeat
MKWHEFVFSTRRNARLMRHAVFWTAWWLYLIVCNYVIYQPNPDGKKAYYVMAGQHLLPKTFLLLLVGAIACYSFNYLILPQLLKGQRLKPAANIAVLCALLYYIGYFIYWTIFPFIDNLFGTYDPDKIPARFWPGVSLGLIDPLKIVASAAIIKYVKYWWQKQQESKKLGQEKIDAELQLLKAQIHPNFLFTSLNNIYEHSLTASARASQMLLKLSDLLSYMLYECDETFVPVEREVEMMKAYMELEKIRLNNEIEVELNTRGDMTDKILAPFLLLPFIENSFKQSSYLPEHAWLNMDIAIEDEALTVKLTNGVLQESNALQAFSENGLANVRKRLSLIYPQRHELKIAQQGEILFVLLKIQFPEKFASQPSRGIDILISETYNPQSNLYAAQ